jgi:ABC-type nitrate/sulfonate/bicarbonate transport system permease component
MAGELLVVIPGAGALGNRLAFAQEFGDATGLLAHMIVILVIGMIADRLFSAWSQGLRRARGLADM